MGYNLYPTLGSNLYPTFQNSSVQFVPYFLYQVF